MICVVLLLVYIGVECGVLVVVYVGSVLFEVVGGWYVG